MAGLGVCDIEDIGISVLTSVIGHQKKERLGDYQCGLDGAFP